MRDACRRPCGPGARPGARAHVRGRHVRHVELGLIVPINRGASIQRGEAGPGGRRHVAETALTGTAATDPLEVDVAGHGVDGAPGRWSADPDIPRDRLTLAADRAMSTSPMRLRRQGPCGSGSRSPLGWCEGERRAS